MSPIRPTHRPLPPARRRTPLLASAAAALLSVAALAAAAPATTVAGVPASTTVATVNVDLTAQTPTGLRLGSGSAWTSGDNTVDPLTGAARPAPLQAAADAGVSVLRFPSGLYSNCYAWMRGVGDQGSRPPQLNNWSPTGPTSCYAGSVDHFGTDEFMTEVQTLSALEGRAVSPIITVNICANSPGDWCGSGGYTPICPHPNNPDVSSGCTGALAAAHWVEYLNGDASTTYGSLRVRNTGRVQPYGVHWFEIGNETPVLETASQPYYSDILRVYAQQMKAVDPSIGIIAQGDCLCSAGSTDTSREAVILQHDTQHLVDAVAPHLYVNGGDSYNQMNRYLTSLSGTIDAAGRTGTVAVMPTEWAATDTVDATTVDIGATNGDMAAALNDATDYMAFLRHGVTDAEYFTMNGYPYQLFHCSAGDPGDGGRECGGGVAGAVTPYLSAPGQVMKLLTGSLNGSYAATTTSAPLQATATTDGVTVNVQIVNHSLTSAQPVSLSLNGGLLPATGALTSISASPLAEDVSRVASDYPASTLAAVPVTSTVSLAAGGTVTVPPFSVSVLSFQLASAATLTATSSTTTTAPTTSSSGGTGTTTTSTSSTSGTATTSTSTSATSTAATSTTSSTTTSSSSSAPAGSSSTTTATASST